MNYIIKIPVEQYSRIVGYYRPKRSWNPGKQREYDERSFYKIPENLKPKKERLAETG